LIQKRLKAVSHAQKIAAERLLRCENESSICEALWSNSQDSSSSALPEMYPEGYHAAPQKFVQFNFLQLRFAACSDVFISFSCPV